MKSGTVALSILVLVLAGCATGVSFQSANLGFGRSTERVDGLLARPSGNGRFPAVVLLHTCGGVTPHVSADWPAFLTANGYAALTVDTFGSRGYERCPGARHLGGTTMWQDAYGALDYLANRPDIDPDRIGVMGFSLGASAIEGFAAQDLKSPRGRNFKAGIAAYGRCNFFAKLSFPVLEIIGDKDRNAVGCSSDAGIGLSVAILPGAYHAFDQAQITAMRIVSGNHPAMYDPGATERAQALARTFFDTHLLK